MTTHVPKVCVFLAALSLVALAATLARAEWFYDFNEPPVPASLASQGWTGNPPALTQHFSLSAAGGYLTISDSLPVSQGGTSAVDVFNPEVFDGDVRVSATINPGGFHSAGYMGVSAMGLPGHYRNYFAAVNFGLDNDRHLWVGKSFDGTTNTVSVSSSGTIPSLTSDYFIELDVTQAPTSVTVTGRLFDHEGGTQLLQAALTDVNLGGVAPYRSGVAAVTDGTAGDRVLWVSFDNIRAVPEPATVTLLSAGALGLMACAWRRLRLTV